MRTLAGAGIRQQGVRAHARAAPVPDRVGTTQHPTQRRHVWQDGAVPRYRLGLDVAQVHPAGDAGTEAQMNWVGRSAATVLLGASTFVTLAAPNTNVPSESPRPSQQAPTAPNAPIQAPGAASAPEQQRHAITQAGASGCTVATADRSTTAVAQCTGCHGELGTARGRNMFQMPGHEFGHPVDVDLDALRSAHPELYASRADLPAFLPLAGGKITCLTCHDGRAGNPHALARASQKELCLACHKM